MSALVNVTAKPVTLQGYQLTSDSDMHAALEYLSARGYSGSVSVSKASGTATWQMSLVADSGNSAAQFGNVTDWIIIQNDSVATIVTAAVAGQLYTLS